MSRRSTDLFTLSRPEGMNFIRYPREGQHDVFVVDMTKERHRLSELATKTLQKYMPTSKRIMIIAPRKGYAGGHMCQECGHVPTCTRCDIPIAFHQTTSDNIIGLCHICKQQYPHQTTCSSCASERVEFFGQGTQQIAEYIHSTRGHSAYIIENTNVNSPTKIKRTLQELTEQKIIIGTPLLAQPPRDLHVDVLIVLHTDMGLSNPNFHAQRQHYLLMHDIVHNYPETNIILQTNLPEHIGLQAAITHKHEIMTTHELEQRKKHRYPPYGDICVIMYKNEVENRVFSTVNKLYQELVFLKTAQNKEQIDIFATPPLVYKMFDKYRYHIIVKGPEVRTFLEPARLQLKIKQRGFKIDRDPRQIV